MAAFTTIDDPEAYFQTLVRSGTGTSTAFTFAGTTDMQPDVVWTKARDEANGHHGLHDSVRGAGQWIRPDYAIAEESPVADALTAFGSDGFTMGADAGNYDFNESDDTYVDWCWKAGTTSGIDTTGADTTPSGYSFNTTSNFSIIEYTGNTTAGHKIANGCSFGVPEFLIIKNIATTGSFYVYHHLMSGSAAASATDRLFLNTNEAVADDDAYLNDTVPTSVLLTLGDGAETNGNSQTMMAYQWRGVQGYSKFGAYEGNGNADGTFVYTGFRPAWIMTKSVDSTSDWHIFDNKREGYNVDNDPLACTGAVEATTDMIDILSNGFKCRIATDPNVAETYIYVAFAEAPFVNSNGVPCNAR